jgi:hypothetical protein
MKFFTPGIKSDRLTSMLMSFSSPEGAHMYARHSLNP